MTLAFSTEINGNPTYFIEKIWASLIDSIEGINISDYEKYLNDHQSKFGKDFGYDEMMISPKIHTIRQDKSNRWKDGNKIHFAINNRTSNRFQFAPIVKCKSVQKIRIDYDDAACDWYGCEPVISVDDKILSLKEVEELSINDGFEDSQAFCKYFNKDFEGKIIHWTDSKY